MALWFFFLKIVITLTQKPKANLWLDKNEISLRKNEKTRAISNKKKLYNSIAAMFILLPPDGNLMLYVLAKSYLKTARWVRGNLEIRLF